MIMVTIHRLQRKTLSAQLLLLLFQILITVAQNTSLHSHHRALRGAYESRQAFNDLTHGDSIDHARVLKIPRKMSVTDIFSSTMSIRLDPVQHIHQVDDHTASVFEVGMLNFLKSHLSRTESYALNTLSVTITRSSITLAQPKSFQYGNPMMHVEIVVTGQNASLDSIILDPVAFGRAIVKVCSDKETEFIMSLRDAEKKMIGNRGDSLENRFVFDVTTEVVAEIHYSGHSRIRDGLGVKTVIVCVAISFIIVKMTIVWYICKRR